MYIVGEEHPVMSEYDLQFQADLEKAQALSLESLALEQFRRQKLLSNSGNWRLFVYIVWILMIQVRSSR